MIAITDIILTLAGIVAGFIAGRVSKRTMAAENNPDACTCEHARGYHKNGTGSCQQRVSGGYTCRCQVWDGPERPEDVIKGFSA